MHVVQHSSQRTGRLWTECGRRPQVSRRHYPGFREDLVKVDDDRRNPLGSLWWKIPVCPEMFGDGVSSRSCFLLKFKKISDIGTAPVDEPLELRKIWDMSFLDPCKGVEGDVGLLCRFPNADSPPLSLIGD